MKLELDTNLPELWKESWPGEFEVFSHLEYCCGVPGALFLITTRKENGRPNACYHGWSSFTGDGRAFHAILPHIGLGTHTYANILREREFCVNFLPPSLHEACMRTVAHNDVETDEIQAAGLTAQTARLIKAPRIAEAFLSYECRLSSVQDLSGAGVCALIIGEVVHAAMAEDCAPLEGKCGPDRFAYFVHAAADLRTGAGYRSAIAALRLEQVPEETQNV